MNINRKLIQKCNINVFIIYMHMYVCIHIYIYIRIHYNINVSFFVSESTHSAIDNGCHTG
jgi:hypothetical protein